MKIKKSKNDNQTITSVVQFPDWQTSRTVIYDQMASLWVEYHVIHVFDGSKFRCPSLSILFFWKYFHEMNPLLTYYRWYDWLTEGIDRDPTSYPTESDWVIISEWLPYFWKKGILSVENQFLVISDQSLLNSPLIYPCLTRGIFLPSLNFWQTFSCLIKNF